MPSLTLHPAVFTSNMTATPRFSQEVEAQLRLEGWFPGRKVNVPESSLISAARIGGNVEFLRNALSEFGELTIAPIKRPKGYVWPDEVGLLRFKPCRGSFCTWLETKLPGICPGEWVHFCEINGAYDAWADLKGRVILTIDETIEFYALSLDAFIENMLTGKLRDETPVDLMPGVWLMPADYT